MDSNAFCCGTNNSKFYCFIFLIITGDTFILAAIVMHYNLCSLEDSELRYGMMALIIFGGISVFFAGLSLFSKTVWWLRTFCSIIWVSIGLLCITVSCVLVIKNCSEQIIITVLIVTGFAMILTRGSIFGTLTNMSQLYQSTTWR